MGGGEQSLPTLILTGSTIIASLMLLNWGVRNICELTLVSVPITGLFFCLNFGPSLHSSVLCLSCYQP